MVFKEQLCDWFSKLNSYSRIEYMCAFLHLCHPFELRFLGSFLEDLGKRDFLFLRESETRANNATILGKQTHLPDILTSLTLLHSSNTRCSNALYNVLQSYLQRCFHKTLSKAHEESKQFTDLMTMLTLAVNHPAFSYEQKQSLSEYYLRASEYCNKEENLLQLSRQSETNFIGTHVIPKSSSTSPGSSSSTTCHDENSSCEDIELEEVDLDLASPNSSSSQQPITRACISDLKLKDANNRLELNIQVTLSDGIVLDIWKSSKELYDFHSKLVSLYPVNGDQDTKIPCLRTNIHKEEKHFFSNYIRNLLKIPKHILDCHHVIEFFSGDHPNKMVYQTNLSPKSTYCPSSSPSNLSGGTDEDAIHQYSMKSVTFNNSNFPLCPPMPRHYDNLHSSLLQNRQLIGPVLTAQTESPSHSPLSSSTDSTQNSPSASPMSQTSEMSSVTQLLKLFKMEEYSDQLNKYTVQQLISFNEEDLVRTSLPKEAQVKLKIKLFEHFRERSNGIVEHHIIPNISPMNSAVPWQSQFAIPPPNYLYPNPNIPTTRDSSPSNSETSSPPASPHLNLLPSNLIKSTSSSGSEDRYQREEKENTPTGSSSRVGKQQSKYHVQTYRQPDGQTTQHIPCNYPEPSQEIHAIPNGYQSDNPHSLTTALRPDMIPVRPYSTKPVHPNIGYPKHVVMMPPDKVCNPIASPYVIAQLPGMRNDYPMPTTMIQNMVDSQNRPFMNQPGILGQPPNTISSRPGFSSVTTTMTNVVGPNSSLTPTPPMTVNTGTKSPNGIPTLVNSSSDPNLQNHDRSNSPSPLQVTNPAITTVPCSTGGPIVHNVHHQPCSKCGSPRSQPSFQFPGYIPTSNGFMQTSMPHHYPHFHPPLLPNGFSPDLMNMHHQVFHNYPVQPFMGFYGNAMYPGMVPNKKTNCYNCGSSSHKGGECKETTMESSSGHYHLNYKVKSDSD